MADVDAFIARWKTSGASERANFQPFLVELCAVIGVDPPDPASARAAENTYCFERGVRYAEEAEGQRGLIDLYRKDAFVMEAKQGPDAPAQTEKEELTGEKLRRKMGTARRGTPGWAQAMTKAKHQARRYARALPADNGWPPFLAVVDVDHCIDSYADFARQGKTYTQFPDAGSFRIELEDLRLTMVQPLREEWEATQAAAARLEADDRNEEAIDELRIFHERLCTVKVLDPACGSGNFLYVTLEHLNRGEKLLVAFSLPPPDLFQSVR